MAREYKVYGTIIHVSHPVRGLKQVRVAMASKIKKAFLEATKAQAAYISENGNEKEVAVAMANPDVLLGKDSPQAHQDGEYVPLVGKTINGVVSWSFPEDEK